MNDTLVLIPAYQPTENLTELANLLYAIGFRIVVVDDGSGEKYSDIFDRTEAYATVIGYEENKGKGYALRYGIDFIIKEKPYFKYLITVDSDGQHSESAVRSISAEIHKSGGIVSAQRDSKKCNISKKEQFGNFLLRSGFALLTGIYIGDIRSGLRAFEFTYLENLTKVKGDGFEYEVNVLLDAVKNRVPVRCVKIEESDWQLPHREVSHYNAHSDFGKQFNAILKVGYPSVIAMLINYVCILLTSAIAGSGTAATFGAVLLGSYIGVGASVILNNRIGFEKNTDGILSYNRILTGMLRMFAYEILVLLLHNVIGIGMLISLIISVLITAAVELRLMKNGTDSDLRVRPTAFPLK